MENLYFLGLILVRNLKDMENYNMARAVPLMPRAVPLMPRAVLRAHGPHRDDFDFLLLQHLDERFFLVARVEAVRQHQELLPLHQFRARVRFHSKFELDLLHELYFLDLILMRNPKDM